MPLNKHNGFCSIRATGIRDLAIKTARMKGDKKQRYKASREERTWVKVKLA